MIGRDVSRVVSSGPGKKSKCPLFKRLPIGVSNDENILWYHITTTMGGEELNLTPHYINSYTNYETTMSKKKAPGTLLLYVYAPTRRVRALNLPTMCSSRWLVVWWLVVQWLVSRWLVARWLVVMADLLSSPLFYFSELQSQGTKMIALKTTVFITIIHSFSMWSDIIYNPPECAIKM